MKVIVFVSTMEDADVIGQVIESCAHHVVATVTDPSSLYYSTAQLTPHALVAESRHHVASTQAVETYGSIYPDVLIWTCNFDRSDWQGELTSFLGRPRKKAAPRPYAQGPRVVYHAAPLMEKSSGEKLKRPKYTEGWQRECEQQEARFVMMLQAGRETHPAALHYYRCLRAQAPGLHRETAYRLVHSSYKAYWARDLAARWLGLLCHYIVGTELDFLPSPMSPGPTVDYIGHEMSDEGLYAATLVLIRGVSPAVTAEIRFLGSAYFRQQSEEELFLECLRLYGFATLLAQVGTALVRLMTRWLDPVRSNSDSSLRLHERHLGILRDFYHMPHILHSPHPLREILRGYHAGTTYVPHPPAAPSFRLWRQAMLESRGENMSGESARVSPSSETGD